MFSLPHVQLAQQFFGHFVGELLSHAGNQYPFGIVRDGCRARHAVIEQGARAAIPDDPERVLIAGVRKQFSDEVTEELLG